MKNQNKIKILFLVKVTWVLFMNTFLTLLYGQSTFRLFTDIQETRHVKAQDVVASGTTTSLSTSANIIANVSDSKTRDEYIEIHRINNSENLEGSFKLCQNSRSVSSFQSIADGSKLYILSEAITNDTTSLILSRIDMLSGSIDWTYLIDTEVFFNTGKIILTAQGIVILYQKENGADWSQDVLCKIDFKGNYLWKKILMSDRPMIHYKDVAINSSGNIFVVCTSFDSAFRDATYLLGFDSNGKLKNSRSLKFFNQNGSKYDGGYFFLSLETNGTNVHVIAQPVLGIDDLGNIIITYFDEALTLRTWRNYSPKLIVEDFKNTRGRFIFSGRQPIFNGSQGGYALVTINNSNAIPELTSIYRTNFNYFPSTTNSGICPFGFNGTLVATSIYSPMDFEQINVIIQSDSITRSCSENFTFQVTKDRIDTSTISLFGIEEIVNPPSCENYHLDLQSIGATKEILCAANNVIDAKESDRVRIISQTLDQIIIQSQSHTLDKQIKLYSSDGTELDLHSVKMNNEHLMIDISYLTGGLYFIQIPDHECIKFFK